MAQQLVDIEGLGEVTIVKRRGSRNLRITVASNRKVRVSQPTWLPYSAGIKFAKSHIAWVETKLASLGHNLLANGMIVGKSHRLRFIKRPGATRSRVTDSEIIVSGPDDPLAKEVQAIALTACQRALRRQALDLLPQRVEELADTHAFKYRSLKIKKMTSRWGSCSSRGDIAISYLIMQLPWAMIDHVIVHELVHTRHMNHSPDFWTTFEAVAPGAKEQRKQMRELRPSLLPI